MYARQELSKNPGCMLLARLASDLHYNFLTKSWRDVSLADVQTAMRSVNEMRRQVDVASKKDMRCANEPDTLFHSALCCLEACGDQPFFESRWPGLEGTGIDRQRSARTQGIDALKREFGDRQRDPIEVFTFLKNLSPDKMSELHIDGIFRSKLPALKLDAAVLESQVEVCVTDAKTAGPHKFVLVGQVLKDDANCFSALLVRHGHFYSIDANCVRGIQRKDVAGKQIICNVWVRTERDCVTPFVPKAEHSKARMRANRKKAAKKGGGSKKKKA
jgi:hypothetical protein